jgi:hypothetical protein
MSESVFSTYANAETDARIAAIGGELDPQRRRELIADFGRYQRDAAAAVFIAFADEPYGASGKVGHWPTLSSQATNVDLITRREAVSGERIADGEERREADSGQRTADSEERLAEAPRRPPQPTQQPLRRGSALRTIRYPLSAIRF